MSKYFTRSGDDGYTSRLGKGRLPKHHTLIEAVGILDEASAMLGLARSVSGFSGNAGLILSIQRDLYHIMAEISASEEAASNFRIIDETRVAWLEDQIETLGRTIEMPSDFIVPGDSLSGAVMALSRTAIRKAERRIAKLQEKGEIHNVELVRYLNRLSSLFFILEIMENRKTGKNQLTLAKKISK
jgi:cob(I)alamin adenosyltransferase